MSTYAQEKKAKDAAKAKAAKKYVYAPVMFDVLHGPKGLGPGAVVVKVHPGYGAPANGTMGMTYVGDAETGEFIGMVCLASLKPV